MTAVTAHGRWISSPMAKTKHWATATEPQLPICGMSGHGAQWDWNTQLATDKPACRNCTRLAAQRSWTLP